MNQSTTPERAVAWEHPPEHGPAVFITDRQALETTGRPLGGWIDPTSEPEVLAVAVEHTVGPDAAEQGAWVITDQLDLGPVMLPEELSVSGLHRIATHLAEARGAR